jgi:S-adenosylmethionine:tRNA ribosyltransferase-isomerase
MQSEFDLRSAFLLLAPQLLKPCSLQQDRPAALRPTTEFSDFFIYPGVELKLAVTGLITNFHLPKSTLILLVSAYYGRDRILAAYSEAVKQRYRFFSLGDAMLLLQ